MNLPDIPELPAYLDRPWIRAALIIIASAILARLVDFLITRVLSLLGTIAVVLAYLLYNFTARTEGQADDTPLPRTAIVFTGAYDRIDLGLELVSSDKIDRLLIAGANRTSGLIKTLYPDLFDPTAQQGQWVESGRIVLGFRSEELRKHTEFAVA